MCKLLCRIYRTVSFIQSISNIDNSSDKLYTMYKVHKKSSFAELENIASHYITACVFDYFYYCTDS